jgi:hypothetical protein
MKGFDNSYMVLRKAIGILGIAFPLVLLLGSIILNSAIPFESSISCYYHTLMRNIFEGVIWIFSIMLVFYQYKGRDNVITTIAGLCALGVALCPTNVSACITCTPASECNDITGNFHNVFASAFFILLSVMSLFLFTKTHEHRKPTPRKLQRNIVYRVCGIIMLCCIVAIALYWTVLEKGCPCLSGLNPVFWLETIALWAFGISWIVKGEIILKDKVINPE